MLQCGFAPLDVRNEYKMLTIVLNTYAKEHVDVSTGNKSVLQHLTQDPFLIEEF